MLLIIADGNVFCGDGKFRRADVLISGGIIAEFSLPNAADAADTVDAADCYVVPGFIDIHIHGAMNADFSDGSAGAISAIAGFLLKQGVTSFLGTTMAFPEERLADIFEEAKPLVNKSFPGKAVLRGINMEGPFFSKEKRGAQNEKYLSVADYDMFCRLNDLSGGNIRTVAVAPEITGGLDFIKRASRDCCVSVAHTCADYDTAAKAFEYGANHVTHMFNGMMPFDHRNPGVPGAARDSRAYIELISDGAHIHPSAVRAAFKLFGEDRVCLISDAMRACGMPDGEYDLGGLNVTVGNGSARIDNGSLAGSITPLTECFRRAVSFGVPLEGALIAATANPARSVGLYDEVGSIEKGKRADILILNSDLSLRHIVLGGELCDTEADAQ